MTMTRYWFDDLARNAGWTSAPGHDFSGQPAAPSRQPTGLDALEHRAATPLTRRMSVKLALATALGLAVGEAALNASPAQADPYGDCIQHASEIILVEGTACAILGGVAGLSNPPGGVLLFSVCAVVGLAQYFYATRVTCAAYLTPPGGGGAASQPTTPVGSAYPPGQYPAGCGCAPGDACCNCGLSLPTLCCIYGDCRCCP